MGYYQRDFSVPDARVDNWSLRGAEEEKGKGERLGK